MEPYFLVLKSNISSTPCVFFAIDIILSSYSFPIDKSISSFADFNSISAPTLETNNATTIDAKESKILNPIIAPPIPINAAIDDKASDLWCQASAFNAGEFILFATLIVILYWYSFISIDITETINGSIVGTLILSTLSNDIIPPYPIF